MNQEVRKKLPKIYQALTHERLKELLAYDAETGEFTWIAKPCKNMPAGSRAGGFTAEGYRAIRVDTHLLKEHRLAWFYVYGEWPVGVIDHINGNTSDNRIANIRDVSQRENLQNQVRAHSNNSTRMLGVSRVGRKFAAHIRIDGKKTFLGSFSDSLSAHQAYVRAKRQFHSTGML